MSEKKEYWKPSVTADVVVVDIHQAKYRNEGAFVNLLLIKRNEKSDAFPNCWALPGGFLEEGESLPVCALRELKEETGLDGEMLAPIGVFSKPERDPRGQVISSAYMTILMSSDEKPLDFSAGDDAQSIALFRLKGDFSKKDGSLSVKLYCHTLEKSIEYTAEFDRDRFGQIFTRVKYDTPTQLAFDHAEIIARAILRAPDLVLPTTTKPVGSESKKELSEHLSK